MPGGPSMISTPPRPRTSAVTNAPITFNSPARPRIGGVTSRWPPTSKRPVEGPTRCPVYRLLDCHCSAVIVGIRPSTRNTHRRCSACTRSGATMSVHVVGGDDAGDRLRKSVADVMRYVGVGEEHQRGLRGQ